MTPPPAGIGLKFSELVWLRPKKTPLLEYTVHGTGSVIEKNLKSIIRGVRTSFGDY